MRNPLSMGIPLNISILFSTDIHLCMVLSMAFLTNNIHTSVQHIVPPVKTSNPLFHILSTVIPLLFFPAHIACYHASSTPVLHILSTDIPSALLLCIHCPFLYPLHFSPVHNLCTLLTHMLPTVINAKTLSAINCLLTYVLQSSAPNIVYSHPHSQPRKHVCNIPNLSCTVLIEKK